MTVVQDGRFRLIAEFFRGEQFCCAVAAICLLLDLDHCGAEFVSAHDKYFVVAGINCARYRNMTPPLLVLPKDLPRQGFYSNYISQRLRQSSVSKRIRR